MRNSCFARFARAVFIFVHFAATLVLLTTCNSSQIFPALLSDINGLQYLPEAVLALKLYRFDKQFFFSLQLMSALKTGAVANNRFAVIIDRHHKHLTEQIPVDRSGGGL